MCQFISEGKQVFTSGAQPKCAVSTRSTVAHSHVLGCHTTPLAPAEQPRAQQAPFLATALSCTFSKSFCLH